MNDSDHGRARELLLASLAEGVREADRLWLEAHLAGCAGCAGLGRELGAALAALRLPEVLASPALLSSTQRRLHARARERTESEGRTALIAATVFAVAVLIATASGLVVVAAWLADRARLALPLSLAAAMVLWLLPVTGTALLAVLVRARLPQAAASTEESP